MELRRLEQSLAVAGEKNFTRASARVHLVQSALSVSIQVLERELGVRLFDRTSASEQLQAEVAFERPDRRGKTSETARPPMTVIHEWYIGGLETAVGAVQQPEGTTG